MKNKKSQVLEISFGKDGIKVNGKKIGQARMENGGYLGTVVNHKVGDKVRYTKNYILCTDDVMPENLKTATHTVTEVFPVKPDDFYGKGKYTSGQWVRTDKHINFNKHDPRCTCQEKEYENMIDAGYFEPVKSLKKKVVLKSVLRRVAVMKAAPKKKTVTKKKSK